MSKGKKAKGHNTGEKHELCQVIKNLRAQRSSYKQFTEQLDEVITQRKVIAVL